MKDQQFDPVVRAMLKAGLYAGAAFCVFGPGALFNGCGDSGGPGASPPPAGGSQTSTTTVAAVVDSVDPNAERKPTQNGNKITRVDNNGSVVEGENIVYTVNGQKDESTRPEDKQVQTGDVIDLVDLQNGSRTSIVVL